MNRSVGALILLASLLPAAASAQSTRRVFVDATTDSGATVTDLRAEEFEIREGGERREISAVSTARRPMRLILMVDSGEGIRQPIGQVRRALTGFLETVDPQHEMMLITISGTMQVRVQPTLERKPLVDQVDRLFGTSGVNPMHRIIDEVSRRFAQTTDRRAVIVVVTAEGFASAQQVNPKDIARIGDEIRKRGGVLHAVRLLVPASLLSTIPPGEAPTELPVSTMVSRGTGGIYRDISVAGLAEVLQSLATEINRAHERTPLSYQVEYASAPVKGKKPSAPEVRVTREGVRLSVVSSY